MAGVDTIGGQILPQGEDYNVTNQLLGNRIGEFYHYMLAKLASSAASIEPLKKGRSFCEIFGAYGWSAGLRLEKYLLDHCMVRGINHFVPHAFSAKEFPDPDCPPHFYAEGHNPQHRHFGSLMAYTNRLCELISDGKHIANVAVLYHGEAEWTGQYMASHVVGHILCDAQIDYDYIPQDVWSNQSYYGTDIEDNCLHINTQRYQVLIIPQAQFITKDLAYSLVGMQEKGVKVFFVGAYPEGICNEHMSREEQMLLEQIREYPVIQRDELVSTMQQEQCTDITLVPAHNRVRYYHYEHTDGTGVYLFCNEGTDPFDGCIHLSDSRHGYEYCAWNNTLTKARYNGAKLTMYLEPLKSYVLILDPEATHTNDTLVAIQPVRMIDKTHVIPLDRWERSVCRSKEYPEFGECVPIKLPDTLHELQPEFSGMVRYESSFIAQKGQKIAIEITDAHEGVEVFINQISLGIQIVPTFLFYMADELIDGSNALVIEVATTLERELAHIPDMMGVVRPAQGLSGLTGQVTLYLQE